MHRFFLPPECFSAGSVAFPPPQAHQLREVLRLRPGDRVVALDNSGWEHEVELLELGKSAATGAILDKRLCPSEPEIKIALFQALLKNDRFEFVLQKGTELGVSAFVPLLSERYVAREPNLARYDRWQRIIAEAAEQSQRGRLPALEPPRPFAEACRQASSLALIPWEGERTLSLHQALEGSTKPEAVSLFIGPEGGFTAGEIEMARACGLVPVSLGRRILRAETAALAAISAVLYHCGEMG